MSSSMISVREEALKAGQDNISINRSEITDRLKVMMKQECTIYRIDDYLGCTSTRASTCTGTVNPPASESACNKVDALCRYKMAQWCFTLVDYLQLDREMVYIAMSYLDRFLATGSPRARCVAHDLREYQLASMTAIYMAIKIFEPKIMDAAQITALSRGQYNTADIIRMESDMLFDLKWHMNGPTAASFLVYFLALLPPTITIGHDSILENAIYQIELSVTQYKFITQHPSTVAIAALINSIKRVASNRNSLHAQARRMIDELEKVTGVDANSPTLGIIAESMNELQDDIKPAFDMRSCVVYESPIPHARKSAQVQNIWDRTSPTACM